MVFAEKKLCGGKGGFAISTVFLDGKNVVKLW
jgi:hypothetical protein